MVTVFLVADLTAVAVVSCCLDCVLFVMMIVGCVVFVCVCVCVCGFYGFWL